MYGSCSATCGEGTFGKTRFKSVIEKNGGTCTGDGTTTEACSTLPGCPGWKNLNKGGCNHGIFYKENRILLILISTINLVNCQWSNWGEWNDCSKTCEGGVETRTREKLVEEANGGICPDFVSSETKECNPEDCWFLGIRNIMF